METEKKKNKVSPSPLQVKQVNLSHSFILYSVTSLVCLAYLKVYNWENINGVWLIFHIHTFNCLLLLQQLYQQYCTFCQNSCWRVSWSNTLQNDFYSLYFFIIVYETENVFQTLDLDFYVVYKNLVLANDIFLILFFVLSIKI